jgi:DNA-binding response OmpR family regulator
MILDHIWDSEEESVSNIVEVHIKYLRDQVDKPFDKKLVKTVHGFGYKIEA